MVITLTLTLIAPFWAHPFLFTLYSIADLVKIYIHNIFIIWLCLRVIYRYGIKVMLFFFIAWLILGWLYDEYGSYDLPFLLAGIPPIVGGLALSLIRCFPAGENQVPLLSSTANYRK